MFVVSSGVKTVSTRSISGESGTFVRTVRLGLGGPTHVIDDRDQGVSSRLGGIEQRIGTVRSMMSMALVTIPMAIFVAVLMAVWRMILVMMMSVRRVMVVVVMRRWGGRGRTPSGRRSCVLPNMTVR